MPSPSPEAPDAPARASSRQVRVGALGVLAFWCLVMGLLYLVMNQVLQPQAVTVSANGELAIPRARDGHFYAPGSINGQPVTFLVDTGASVVSVSQAFANAADLPQGKPMVFNTANGPLRGHMVSDMRVSVGPLSVSGLRVGVGLQGFAADQALLGQNFLSKFQVLLERDRMLLRPRTPETRP